MTMITSGAPNHSGLRNWRNLAQPPDGTPLLPNILSSHIAKTFLQRQVVDSFDADRDGSLSIGEFRELGKNSPAGTDAAATEALFASLDRTGDSKLEHSEVASSGLLSANNMRVMLGVQDLGAWSIARADKDGDGALSEEEFGGLQPLPPPVKVELVTSTGERLSKELKMLSSFSQLDPDKDGKLSAAELDKLANGPDLSVFRETNFSSSVGGLLLLNDADRDDALSAEELAGAVRASRSPDSDASSLLGAADSDGDGKASAAELLAMSKALPTTTERRQGAVPTSDQTLLAELLRSSVDRLVGRLSTPAPVQDVTA